MRTILLAVAAAALVGLPSAAFAQSAAEQQIQSLNRNMSQQIQQQQQNQAVQYQLDNLRMRQQIDATQQRGGGSPGCPIGATGC